jgi:integrase/recombinase XerD
MANAREPCRAVVRLQMKLENWPRIDQTLWAQSMEAGDILSPASDAADWRSATRTSVQKGYGRWLAWLAAEKLLDEASSPVARLDPSIVSSYIDYLRASLASTTVWSYLHALCMAVSAVEPQADIDWLWLIVKRLHWAKVPIRQKSNRVMPSLELYKYGCACMDEAASGNSEDGLSNAVLYRNGLMIALLAARPIRIRNLQSIAIGKQLIKANGDYYLQFRAAETKTDKALEFMVPHELSRRVDHYISNIRPILLQRMAPKSESTPRRHPGAALWISMFGTAMTECSIYQSITGLTRKKFGHHVNPHLFRDCAATSIALEDPDHVQITTSILGHATLSTSERYYNHALAVKAVGLHQATILNARKGWKKAQRQ